MTAVVMIGGGGRAGSCIGTKALKIGGSGGP
jgi:hypothetical protein